MAALSQPARFNLDGWAVEPALDRLSRDGVVRTLEPRVMEMLVYLARRAGEVVSTDELAAEVWAGTIIGDRPVYQCIARLRRALGDNVRRPQYVATIPKRGYRLIAPVCFDDAKATPASHAPKRKSIAVLSFVDMSEGQSLGYLGDSIAEELIHTLSCVAAFQVAARSSSFSFKGQCIDIATIGRKLNVESVLEGSVRKSGERLRITAQLIDLADGYHIWSKSYDRTVDNVFALQDEIAASVLQALYQCEMTGARPEAGPTVNAQGSSSNSKRNGPIK